MDIRRLDRDLSYVCLAGNTLSCEQQVVLYNSLTNLQNENNFTNVYFWGKILGTESDYFLAYGFRKDVIKGKVFFYSTNCVDWGVLPLSSPAVANLALICQAPFQGDPSLVLNVSKEGFDGFDIDESHQDMVASDSTSGECRSLGRMISPQLSSTLVMTRVPGPTWLTFHSSVALSASIMLTATAHDVTPSVASFPFLPIAVPPCSTRVNEGLVAPLKEEDRLSATVWAVTEAAAVVPRGVFVVTSDDGCLSWNPCFVGLGHSKAVSLSHYLHLRPPRKPWNTCLLTAASPNPAIDCLDSVDTDFPPDFRKQHFINSGDLLNRAGQLYVCAQIMKTINNLNDQHKLPGILTVAVTEQMEIYKETSKMREIPNIPVPVSEGVIEYGVPAEMSETSSRVEEETISSDEKAYKPNVNSCAPETFKDEAVSTFHTLNASCSLVTRTATTPTAKNHSTRSRNSSAALRISQRKSLRIRRAAVHSDYFLWDLRNSKKKEKAEYLQCQQQESHISFVSLFRNSSSCWSLQLECGSHVVVLRNLLWPGAVGYHAVGTPDHGYVYIGSGKRNLDLPFMV
ncbi:uncharacterized protein LOC124803234 [Schistocerca piceifrons]|uniref:uncharacterized protein LOC124803234 n=1 Tax=Schistocerca piceifrons TaxID=274613 RepID=UPI001F5E6559|nr:uncharacterized protein LOC124803234 [Schistocerca piceifrons]